MAEKMERKSRKKPKKEPQEIFDFPHFAVVGYEDNTYDYLDVWDKVKKKTIRAIETGRDEWNFEAKHSGKWYKGKFIKSTSKS